MRRSAFSLVELSIVLVILGLLVGGVLGGQSLIKAAQLRTILTDKDKYLTAVNAFQVKYSALPGDFVNATSYWTPAHATNATCLTTVRTAASTCNGNGDGVIGAYYTASDVEYNLAWEQLSLAGLVPGNYQGYPTLSVVQPDQISQAGVTAPLGKINGSGWTFGSKAVASAFGASGAYSAFWRGRYNHQLVLAARNSAALDRPLMPGSGILSGEDTYQIDAKIDDGKPGTGSMRTNIYGAAVGDCASSDTWTDYATATYVFAGANCKPMFDLGF